MISTGLKHKIVNYFNQGGYILDFGNERFDNFTERSIGKPIQTWASKKNDRNLSKGKSFEYFIFNSTDKDIFLLVSDLMEYMHSFDYADRNPMDSYDIKNGDKLLEEIEKAYNKSFLADSASELTTYFNDEYLKVKIDELLLLQKTDSPDAIGKAKELLESTFKYILSDAQIDYSKNDNLMALRKKCFRYLNLDTKDNEAASKDNNVKQILSGLTQIVRGMNTLRNDYGSGHGHSPNFKILPNRYSELAVNASITVSQFAWETYNEKKIKGKN